jgi:sirohydrochlorin cobaltochelatase
MTAVHIQGLLLFAHGARDPGWARPFEATAAHCRQALAHAGQGEAQVALAFLEFMSPGLVEAGSALVQSGCTQVAVVPLFLGAGGHVRKDIPELLARLRHAHPRVEFRLMPAVGESPLLAMAMAQVAVAAMGLGEDSAQTQAALEGPSP